MRPRANSGTEPLSIYISVPFCRSKCSYCNFASQVFPAARQSEYIAALEQELEWTRERESSLGESCATLYWGGSTPSLLPAALFTRVMTALERHFPRQPGAECTLEAAPGTLQSDTLAAWQRAGIHRVSLGMQSWQAAELRASGRLHGPEHIAADLRTLRAAGLEEINLDLIAGLPHQTETSWRDSVERTVAASAPHISIYMLDVDEDSRLGRELLAGGGRYHAASVPADDQIAEFYEYGIERLARAGYRQYEISNFALPGHESRHNDGYWLRRPYLGLGVDAHSLLRSAAPGAEDGRDLRWSNLDSLEAYLAAIARGELPRAETIWLDAESQLEEACFLGLRRNEGLDLNRLEREFGEAALAPQKAELRAMAAEGWLEENGDLVRLTQRGRMVGNEVFARMLH